MTLTYTRGAQWPEDRALHTEAPEAEWILLHDPLGTLQPGARFNRYDLPRGKHLTICFYPGTLFRHVPTGETWVIGTDGKKHHADSQRYWEE